MLVKCTKCKKEFQKMPSQAKKSKSGNHFCSSNCSASYNNKNRNRKDKKPDIICLYCNKLVQPTHSNQKYCSNSCQSKYQNLLVFNSLESGNNGTHRACKSYWLNKDPKCSSCGITDWKGLPISLELDHINGDGTNNTLSNTRLLCPNCHSQTSTYKGKNSSNILGKEFRKTRYEKSIK